MTDKTKTIFALSSGRGKAGIAVIRISGPGTSRALEQLAGGVTEPRKLILRTLKSPSTDELLDQALVAWFPGPHSFTGEDMAELHIHGGLAVIEGVLSALGVLDGFESAEPGAFTRRAFYNGKLDLVAIEGLADLIDAETEAQHRQAVRQMEGQLGALYENWRQSLIQVLAYVEATLDFPDEDDVPVRVSEQLRETLRQVLEEIKIHLDDNRRGERLRSGVRVVIAGPPNVGKSSLLNCLAQRDAAIVSSQAGTTRDIIEVHLNLGGMPVILVDTAGIHESADDIEKQGIERAQAQSKQADILLWLCEASDKRFQGANLADSDLIDAGVEPDLVFTKADLAEPGEVRSGAEAVCLISVKTGEGIEALLDYLKGQAQELVGTGHEAVLTRTRHRQALVDCCGYLEQAIAQNADAEELNAEDIRLAARALGRITGRVDVEAVLDVVFADFCIGK